VYDAEVALKSRNLRPMAASRYFLVEPYEVTVVTRSGKKSGF
jgi:hypothetical protein